jgi:hypothetical protein
MTLSAASRSYLSIVAVALACASTASLALDLAPAMERVRTTTEAVVLLVPPMSIYRNGLTEASLHQEGCRHETSDAKAVSALVALLESAKITINPVFQQPDVREGMYLALADGSRLAFFFADNNGGRLPVQGIVETSTAGLMQSSAITAAATLSTDLRQWSATYGGSGDGAACNRRPPPAEGPEPVPAPR